jgi:hypothetical protein
MQPNTPRGFNPASGGQKFDIKKVIEWLGFVLRCPICQFKYNLNNTKVIESEQNDALGEAYLLIHSDCSKCKSSVMFNIEITGPEIFSVGMVTDLTSQDSHKFKDHGVISTNDILALHQGLKTFNGDFIKSFTVKK